MGSNVVSTSGMNVSSMSSDARKAVVSEGGVVAVSLEMSLLFTMTFGRAFCAFEIDSPKIPRIMMRETAIRIPPDQILAIITNLKSLLLGNENASGDEAALPLTNTTPEFSACF